MTSAAPAWDAVLDALEHDLACHLAVVDDVTGQVPVHVPIFVPPAGLGPVPPALAGRARDLHAAYRDAIHRAEARQAQVRAELRRVGANGPATDRPTRSRIDFQG